MHAKVLLLAFTEIRTHRKACACRSTLGSDEWMRAKHCHNFCVVLCSTYCHGELAEQRHELEFAGEQGPAQARDS